MLLSFYGFREQPFGPTPDPRYLYPSPVHREALASLLHGIESNLGFTALISAPGLGKTTLLYYLLSRYEGTARTAFIFETQSDARLLLQHLMSELQINADANDVFAMRSRFKEFLVSQARARRRVLVLIDEAQNLDRTALETIRLLSNFETSQMKLLHILMAGQPQLAETLATPELQNLRQRIVLFTRLLPFSAKETHAYVEHRLAIAGYSGPPLFTPAAHGQLAAASGGIPREINRICFNALSLAYALDTKTIHAGLIEEVSADLDLENLLQPKPRRHMDWHVDSPLAEASEITEPGDTVVREVRGEDGGRGSKLSSEPKNEPLT